jgi:hypothetical protein
LRKITRVKFKIIQLGLRLLQKETINAYNREEVEIVNFQRSDRIFVHISKFIQLALNYIFGQQYYLSIKVHVKLLYLELRPRALGGAIDL